MHIFDVLKFGSHLEYENMLKFGPAKSSSTLQHQPLMPELTGRPSNLAKINKFTKNMHKF